MALAGAGMTLIVCSSMDDKTRSLRPSWIGEAWATCTESMTSHNLFVLLNQLGVGYPPHRFNRLETTSSSSSVIPK
jgi:hypothetical protein